MQPAGSRSTSINRGIAIDSVSDESTNGNAGFDARMIDDIVADLAGKPGALMLVRMR